MKFSFNVINADSVYITDESTFLIFLIFFFFHSFHQESSKCPDEGKYKSKVSRPQVLKTQPFLPVFMLPLGLFEVATVGSAVRRVKLLF